MTPARGGFAASRRKASRFRRARRTRRARQALTPQKIPLLSLLAYIDLTCQNLPTFTLSSLTVHRFLIAGVTAGSKAQCDVFCTNAHYAKVGGIKVGELNNLEREFLRVTGWALCVSCAERQRCAGLRSRFAALISRRCGLCGWTSLRTCGPLAAHAFADDQQKTKS